MTLIMRGKEVTEALNRRLKKRSDKLRARGIVPTLGIIRLGENPDDLTYERSAKIRAAKTGIEIRNFVYSEDFTEQELVGIIYRLKNDPHIHGILLMQPLPDHIDDDLVRNAIRPDKDVDGITDLSMAGVYSGDKQGFPPCTAEACIEMLDHYSIGLAGKNAAIIGRSPVIGKPVAMMLIDRDVTVTICHTKTKDIRSLCRKQDLIIACAGHIGTVTKDFMHESQVIVDVAINFDENGNMCGDTDFAAADGFVRAVSPVPGGIGSVTTGMLMKHVIQAAEGKDDFSLISW